MHYSILSFKAIVFNQMLPSGTFAQLYLFPDTGIQKCEVEEFLSVLNALNEFCQLEQTKR